MGDDTVHDCNSFRVCLELKNNKVNLLPKMLAVLRDVYDNDIYLLECLQQEASDYSWGFFYLSWTVEDSEFLVRRRNSDRSNVSRARLYLIDHYEVQWGYLVMCDCSESHTEFEL